MTRGTSEQDAAAWERRAIEARRGVVAPAGVERTRRPLRVVMLGWACLSMQAREGSGYNLSVSELAAGLAGTGHGVYYLRSGMDYSVRPGMWIQAREFWRGVGCFDFFNSPNLSMANSNFRNVAGQISSPQQTRVITRWLAAVRPDVVHVHSLEGFGLDTIAAVRAMGLPVVVTPHNYYMLCPQVDLMQRERCVCEDYDGGRACVGCIPAPKPEAEVRSRRLKQSGRRMVGHGTVWSVGQGLSFMKRRLAKMGDGREIPIVGADADSTAHLNGEAGGGCAEMPASPADQNERLLAAKNHLVVLNDYGTRRRAGVTALNAASAVLAPSRFLASVHEAMGVEPAKVRHVRLGQPHFDELGRIAQASPFYDTPPWNPAAATGPLRFAFFGSAKYNKGLDTLARAILAVPPELLARAHFNIRAEGETSVFQERLRGVPQVSFLGGYDMAGLLASPGEFDVGLLPTMGLENSPFVLLEHLHAGKFVIASRLGGPTDWIVEGENGLMFAAGNARELAGAISRVIRGEVRIPSSREVREGSVLRSYAEYLGEVVGVYGEVVGVGRGGG